MSVGVIQDKDVLIKRMDREQRETRRRTELADAVQRQRSLKNELIRRKILTEGRIDLLATEILGYRLFDFHKEILRFQFKRKKSLVLAPRDSGKSTILTYTKIIYEILRNPDVRIGLVSNTGFQAEGFLKEVKNHLEGNMKLVEIFGEQMGKKWDAKEIIVKGRKSKQKESTVTCIGVGSALVSKHFDLVIGDDLVDDESSRTELQRERQRTWFYQTLYPCLTVGGQLHLIGTRYHYLDLWGHLIGATEYEGSGEFKNCFLRVKSLEEDLETGEYRSFCIERFTVEALLEKKVNMGTVIFNAQMQNDTEAMKGKVFKDSWFRYYTDRPTKLRVFSGVDLAISDAKTADRFAHVTIGLDEQSNIYVLSFFERRALHPNKQTDVIVDRAEREEPLFVGIESNAYQAAKAIDVMTVAPTINIKKVYTDLDKQSKGWKIAALFEAGKVFIGMNMTRFKDHLLLFTGEKGGDDDLMDAFFNAVKIAIWTKHKKRRVEPGLI